MRPRPEEEPVLKGYELRSLPQKSSENVCTPLRKTEKEKKRGGGIQMCPRQKKLVCIVTGVGVWAKSAGAGGNRSSGSVGDRGHSVLGVKTSRKERGKRPL